MWEKVVLNLLSNAFKFTFDGEIEVSLRRVDSRVEMAERDIGTLIPGLKFPSCFIVSTALRARVGDLLRAAHRSCSITN
jgi:signal transduction histidine kinase